MTDKQLKKCISLLEQRKNNIAKERDKLREILAEYEEMIDCSERAIENLDGAIEALSELV